MVLTATFQILSYCTVTVFNFKYCLTGVADGVSSWRYLGVDASLFPNALMANCIKHLKTNQGKIDPKKLLDMSYQDILKSNEVKAGTVIVSAISFHYSIQSVWNIYEQHFDRTNHFQIQM